MRSTCARTFSGSPCGRVSRAISVAARAAELTRFALLLGRSPIRNLEAELRLELTAAKARHERCAVTNGIVNLLDCHAARELVQDLLSVVVVQSGNLLLERLSLRL